MAGMDQYRTARFYTALREPDPISVPFENAVVTDCSLNIDLNTIKSCIDQPFRSPNKVGSPSTWRTATKPYSPH